MPLTRQTLNRLPLLLEVRGHTVKMRGVLDEPDVADWLVPFLIHIHEEAVSRNMPEVILDIRQLRYVNAGVPRSLVRWLRTIRDSQQSQCSIRLLSDPINRWQRFCVPPLARLGAERLVIR